MLQCFFLGLPVNGFRLSTLTTCHTSQVCLQASGGVRAVLLVVLYLHLLSRNLQTQATDSEELHPCGAAVRQQLLLLSIFGAVFRMACWFHLASGLSLFTEKSVVCVITSLTKLTPLCYTSSNCLHLMTMHQVEFRWPINQIPCRYYRPHDALCHVHTDRQVYIQRETTRQGCGCA